MAHLIQTDKPTTQCPKWDAGWCYANEEDDTDDVAGACQGYQKCNHYKELSKD